MTISKASMLEMEGVLEGGGAACPWWWRRSTPAPSRRLARGTASPHAGKVAAAEARQLQLDPQQALDLFSQILDEGLQP